MNVTLEDLEAAGLDEQFEAVETAVSDHLEGAVSNVAVVAEPFAGRDVFLDYAEEVFGAATGRVTLDGLVTDGLPELPDAEIVLVDDCHYLYARTIDGFDVLETFLERVSRSDSLFVTSWNRYAWSYLSAVTDVDVAFPETIQVPRLDAGQVADLVASYHGSPLPTFVEAEDAGRVKTVDVEWTTRTLWGDRTLSLPRPELNPEYVRSKFGDDVERDVEAVVYQRIAQLSEGDPGVATVLWDRSIRDGEIAPSYVQEVDRPLELDHDAAFVLEVILTNESLERDRLERICEPCAVELGLQALVAQGVVSIDDGRVRIDPERLYSTVEHLAGRQLVW